jgi:hypothetical protein
MILSVCPVIFVCIVSARRGIHDSLIGGHDKKVLHQALSCLHGQVFDYSILRKIGEVQYAGEAVWIIDGGEKLIIVVLYLHLEIMYQPDAEIGVCGYPVVFMQEPV